MPEAVEDPLVEGVGVEEKSCSRGWRSVPLTPGDLVEDNNVLEGTKKLIVGNRRRDETSDNLFEIVPQCRVIKGEGEGEKTLSSSHVLITAGGSESLGLALDDELLILDKDGGGGDTLQCSRRLKFPAKVDFLLWRRSIILVGLNSSEIVLVDPNTFQIKESKRVAPNVPKAGNHRFFVDAAIHSTPDPTKIDMIATNVDGVVYAFQNISLSDGTMDSTQDQDVSVAIDVGSIRGIRIKLLEDEDMGGSSGVICVSSPARNAVVLGQEDGTLSLHDLEEHLPGGRKKALQLSQAANVVENMGFDSSEVKMKKIVHCEGMFFILTTLGTLDLVFDDVLFSSGTIALPNTNSQVVHDFALVVTAEGEVKLWVLFGLPDFSENFIGIFGSPAFSLEFSVRIPTLQSFRDEGKKMISKLVFPSQSTLIEEPFAYIEVSNEGTSVFKMLETSTELTIHKLLARGKFDEAAELATQYGKDLDIVYKAKARSKLNELLNTINPSKADLIFEEMIDSLEKIDDAIFVCDFCSQNGFTRITWIRRLLTLGKSRVKVKDCSVSGAGKKLLLTCKKFYTFEQVFPNPTLQEWIQFVSPENTMFQECKWFLNQQEFEKCEKVWRRHFDEFIPTLKLEDFGPFLLTLFGKQLGTESSISLFKCILPFAVEKCAESGGVSLSSSYKHEVSDGGLTSVQISNVDILLSLVKRQVCSLEREKGWPSEAIEFSKTVISIVKQSKEGLMGSSRGRSDPRTTVQSLIYSEILQKMEIVVQNLVELADLRKYHSIRIPFQRYLEDDVFEVVHSMLCELFQRVEIETFIEKFLTPFAARKEIKVDELYFRHTEFVVSDLPFHINSIDIPQEERLICLISRICNVETKLKAVLTIAKEWPVPWTSGIDSLVASTLRMQVNDDDSTLKDLQSTINLLRVQVPFRCLLSKHRLTATKVQSYFGVTMALTRIIKGGKPDYYQDCLELIKHTGHVGEEKIRCIEFSLKLQQGDLQVMEDFVDPTWDIGLLKWFLARTMQEFRSGITTLYSAEQWKIITGIGKMLANVVDDRKALEFLKLRGIVPKLMDQDIVYDSKYPFSVLNFVMPDYHHKSNSQLIDLCRRLGDITFTHLPDILSVAAAFYLRPGITPPELNKVWELVQHIVKAPGSSFGQNSFLVRSSAFAVAEFLICRCPETSVERLEILLKFLEILTNYDNTIEEVLRMMGNLRVFLLLRDQEIPLETEFRQFYLWLFVEGIPGEDQFFAHLQSIGTTLVKFGDRNLLNKIFLYAIKELQSRASSSYEEKALILRLVDGVKDILHHLLKNYDSLTEPETNKDVLDLVDLLKNEADIVVTPYALRERNKSRFLQRLLASNHFSLAAQVAIIFEVYNDSEAWSRILQGFMDAGDGVELRRVLLDLRNVSELWILPEFASGWKMVAERVPGFLDLCPIPLD